MTAHQPISGPIHGPYVAPRRSVRVIAAEVSEQTGVPLASILAHGRRAEVVRARWQVWALARDQGLSLTQIARATGHNHTTVLHGLRRMAEAAPALTDRFNRRAAA